MHDSIERAINENTCVLKQLHEWLKAHQDCATREDLKHAEERIIAAGDGVITCDDRRLLEALLARGKTITKKLERLDAKTPPG